MPDNGMTPYPRGVSVTDKVIGDTIDQNFSRCLVELVAGPGILIDDYGDGRLILSTEAGLWAVYGDETWITAARDGEGSYLVSHIRKGLAAYTLTFVAGSNVTLSGKTKLQWDETGHVIGGDGTLTISASGGGGGGGDDEKVKVDGSDSAAGYLEDKLVSTSPWISLTQEAGVVGDRLRIAHTAQSSTDFQLGVSGDLWLVPGSPAAADIDDLGHMLDSPTGVSYTHAVAQAESFTAPVTGDNWIVPTHATCLSIDARGHVRNSPYGVVLTHGNAQAEADTIAVLGDAWIVPTHATCVSFDSKGHVRGASLDVQHTHAVAQGHDAHVGSVTLSVTGATPNFELQVEVGKLSKDAKGHLRGLDGVVAADVALVPVTYITQVRWDTSAGKLQKKTRTAYVLVTDNEDANWTDIDASYYDCP